MFKRLLPGVLLLMPWTALSSAAEEPRPQGPLGPEALAFLKTYCLKCHAGKKPKGKLDLMQFQTPEHRHRVQAVEQGPHADP